MFVERSLTRAGIPFEIRDVRVDTEAEQLLRDAYLAYRPGVRPQTPVTLVDGGPPLFGTTAVDALRRAA